MRVLRPSGVPAQYGGRSRSPAPSTVMVSGVLALFAVLAVAGVAAPCAHHPGAHAAQGSNEHLLVSAENPESGNSFAGSMVVEVAVADPAISDVGGGAGEPEVSVNGATLRMAQAGNGYWYAYFANVDAARHADQIYLDAGAPGSGLDFGVFCGPSTPESVLGASFSDSEGVSVPRSGGLAGYADGGSSPLSACSGSVDASSRETNNVVRSPPSLNRHGGMAHGQIGLDPSAWPIVQLFSFSGDVRIQYERGGGPDQRVTLRYGGVESISHAVDRADEPYPARAHVVLRVNDPQLNQDPTDEDSWTFGAVWGSPSAFYQAFYDGGRQAANGGPGLVDLYAHLGRLGFGDNGYVEIDPGDVMELVPNRNQPAGSVSDGRNTYDYIITLAESRPNSGLFESVDSSGSSNMRIAPDAPRGAAATVTYNDRSLSILTGSHTASLSLGSEPYLEVDATGWRSGLRIPIALHDRDQNANPNSRDDLGAFRDDAILPSIRIGSPLTASGASSVVFYPESGSFDGGVAVPSRVPDAASSARLHIDTGRAEGLTAGAGYGMISINMGFQASALHRMLIDGGASPASGYGTNWLHLDLRSLEMELGADGISDAAVLLYFGGLKSDADPVTITDRLGSPAGLVQIDPEDVRRIYSKSGAVYAVLDLARGGGGGLTIPAGSASGPHGTQPVIIDVFSFGVKNRDVVNNAIYRLELEESSRSSGVFEGTLEFAAANQLNIDDPDFIRGMTTVGNNVKFVILDAMVRGDGITITYSDLAQVGATVPRSPAPADAQPRTHTGAVSISTPSGSLRFGIPVTVTLNDPDLNLSADTTEVYRVVDNPSLPSADAVGRGLEVLLEVKIKDVRYKRCVVDGVAHGGLASTGFSLVETGPATGVFEGVFKMPTWICDKSGSKLISTAGGSLDVVYRDARDSAGNANQFSLQRSQNADSQRQQSAPSPSSSPSVRGHTGSIQSGPAAGQPSAPAAPTEPALPPHAFLSPPRVVLRDIGDTANVTLSGSVAGSTVQGGHPGDVVSARIIPPGGGPALEFDLRVRPDGRFGAVLIMQGGADPQGPYGIDLSYGSVRLETVSFYVESGPLVIPSGIRDSALGWSSGTQADGALAGALRELAGMNLILVPYEVPPDDTDDVESGLEAPPWLKRAVMWWASGLVSDETFVDSVQYMINNEILRIGTG